MQCIAALGCVLVLPVRTQGQVAAADVPLDTAAFTVFASSGAETSLDELIDASLGAEVVFLGEAHDDRLGHRLQLEMLERLHARTGRPVVLSLEMFERDVQYIVDEYVSGQIREDHFLASARPWPHYAEDYRPLVEYARSHGLVVLAANAPRRYVNLVTREGPGALAALSAQAKRSLPPLPYAGPSDAYRAELATVLAEHGGATDPGERENGLYAQALWDAGMAYTIADALMSSPDAIVVHLAGAFHVKNGTGIPEQLSRYRPGTRTITVIVEPVADVNVSDAAAPASGDFVILTDRSYSRSQSVGGG